MQNYDLNKVILAFQELMRKNEIIVEAGHPICDGEIHRAPTTKDKGREKSASYKFYLDGVPNGWVNNFQKGNGTQSWCATRDFIENYGVYSPEEYEATIKENQKKREAKQIEREQKQKKVAEMVRKKYAQPEAYALTSLASSYPPSVPYLNTKGIKNLLIKGVFCDSWGRLSIPVYNKEFQLQTEQLIDAQGEKRFAHNGKKENGFHIINLEINFKNDELKEVKEALSKCETIALGEGYATMLSVFASVRDFEKTLFITTFDADNLKKVARELYSQYPEKKYVIVSDNDLNMVGQDAAKIAQETTKGIIMFPPFTPQDFNDVYQTESNREVIKNHFYYVLEQRYGKTNQPLEKTHLKCR